MKKAGIKNMIGWILFAFALLILILMVRNNMNFQATVQQILGWFGK